jgi:hypothetical protein
MVSDPRHAFQRNATYASAADFCRIFAEDMANLYWLSFILTADPGKAEQCFVSGLDDCSAGNQVFTEWARSWARRTVIKNAIRLISPRFVPLSVIPSNPVSNGDSHPANDWAARGHQQEISAVLDLNPFDRFAFVMSVLEGFSDRDCALLLGCTQPALSAGRVRALQRLSESATALRDNALESQDQIGSAEANIPPYLKTSA